jgi:hypothetical protein
VQRPLGQARLVTGAAQGSQRSRTVTVTLLGRFGYDADVDFPTEVQPHFTELIDADHMRASFPKMRDLPLTIAAMNRAFAYHSNQTELPGWSENSCADALIFLIRLFYRAIYWNSVQQRMEQDSVGAKGKAESAAEGGMAQEDLNGHGGGGSKKKKKGKKGKGRADGEDGKQGQMGNHQGQKAELNTTSLELEDPIVQHDRLMRQETAAENLELLDTAWHWHLRVPAWRKFWNKIAHGCAPHWKLYNGRLKHSWLPPTVHSPGRVWFLFDDSYDPRAPGARPVVLHDPMMVIEILLNESITSRAELIKHCVKYGIEHASPCRLIENPSEDQQRLVEQSKALRAAEQNYGVRLRHIDFVADDFIQYVDTLVDWMKRNPRIALLAARRGGLYWRIVHECGVMPDIGAFDEMSDLAAWGYGHTYTCGDFLFGCESLSMEEEAKFVGMFDRWTGKPGDNVANVSFFPRHEIWATCSMNTGTWTLAAEDWFDRRFNNMYDDKTIHQPQTSYKWRHNIRGADVGRLVVNQCRRRAEAFLESRFLCVDNDIWQYAMVNLRGCELYRLTVTPLS